eukprot:CAMPEP_0172670772 /NCGR_PEP_ID=MMETSP1074-20121228/10496_1 /TAXON_ID=2916 /ORGANISM="Ceratium fusus, Strain PA161109" /LENGTH=417 /DNA_ID=CAMNT_0013487725 /DNA_START=44 /DNA_END=1297 /DNA_ORIENTATION=+
MGAAACHLDGDDFEDGLPATAKCSSNGSTTCRRLAWGLSSMQGWRSSMEDAHIAIPSLGAWVAGRTCSQSAGDSARIHGWDETAVFGVMDGHGGAQVARFCELHLPVAIAQGDDRDAEKALGTAFTHMDELLSDPACLGELRALADPGRGPRGGLSRWTAHPSTIGCTAVVCCVRKDALIVANAGDSRAVLCRGGLSVDLSEDHKPDLQSESDRIIRAGGWVQKEVYGPVTVHRVNGDLSLSRAIGDLEYKQNRNLPPGEQVIVATPDVRTFRLDASDEFIILACDGVWDVMDSQVAIDFVRNRLGSRQHLAARLSCGALELSSIVEELLDDCISPNLEQTDGLGGDNMTAILAVFLPPQTGSTLGGVNRVAATKLKRSCSLADPHSRSLPFQTHTVVAAPPLRQRSSSACLTYAIA